VPPDTTTAEGTLAYSVIHSDEIDHPDAVFRGNAHVFGVGTPGEESSMY